MKSPATTCHGQTDGEWWRAIRAPSAALEIVMATRSASSPCFLFLLALVTAALAACGGGGTSGAGPGAGSGGTLPPGTGDQPVGPLRAHLRDYLRHAEDPLPAAQRLAAALGRVHAEARDRVTAAEAVDRAYAATVVTSQDFVALESNRRRLGAWIDPADRLEHAAMLAPASASLAQDPATGRGLVVYFVNGIAVDFGDFEDSKRALASVIESILPDAQVTGTYNVSSTDAERSYFGRAIAAVPDPLAMPLYKAVVQVLLREIVGSFIDLGEASVQFLESFGRFGKTPIIGAGQSREIMRDLKWRARLGQKIVLLPHSQGNFFVRDALRLLKDEEPALLKNIGVVMTGSPESITTLREILPAPEYVRMVHNRDDVVARIGDPLCRQGCVARDQSVLEWLSPAWRRLSNHFFKGGYLADRPLALLKEEVRSLASLLLEPPTPAPVPEDLPLSFQAYPPEIHCAADGGVAIEVAWLPSVGADAYEVLLDGRSVSGPLEPRLRSHRLHGLTVGGRHTVVVRATNARGHRDAPSLSVAIPEEACEVPGSFEVLIAQPLCMANVPAVRISWEHAARSDSYQVYRDGAPVSDVLGPQVVTYVDRQAPPGMSFAYEVRASNTHGTSRTSARSVLVPNDLCTPDPVRRADLVPLALSVDPRRARVGDMLAISFSVGNHGDGAAAASVAHIQISASSTGVRGSDQFLASRIVPALVPGSRHELRADVALPSLQAGPWYVWLSLDADDTAGQSRRDNDRRHTSLDVLTPPMAKVATRLVISRSPSSLKEGERLTMTATLTDARTGAALSGRRIGFGVNRASVDADTTNSQGRAVGHWTASRVGTLPVEAIFVGDSTYLASSATTSVSVTALKRTTRLVISRSPSSLKEGERLTMTATLTDARTGAALSGRRVGFGVNRASVDADTTNSQGRAVGHWTANRVGTLAVEAIFVGDSTYLGANASTSVSVVAQARSTRLDLSVSPTSVLLGASATLRAVLRDQGSGQLISGRYVEFSIAGSAAGRDRTNSQGVAEISWKSDRAGSMLVGASHAASATYAASSDSASLLVQRQQTKKGTRITLSFTPRTAELGEPVLVRAKLEDSSLARWDLEGKLVSVLVNGVRKKSGRTDRNGLVDFYYTATSLTRRTVFAEFGGDSGYSNSSASAYLAVRDTTDPLRVVLKSPSHRAVLATGRPLLSWSRPADAGGIKHFELYIDYKWGVLWRKRGSWTVSTTGAYPPTLVSDSYRWRVRAVDNSGNIGAWSTWREFDIK